MNDKKEIDQFSVQIASKLNDEKYQFDLGLIVIIGSIIIGVLQLLMKCNVFGRNIEDRIKNPGPLDKILLRKVVKNKLPEEYAGLKTEVQEQILAQVKNLSSESINAMIKEAKNAG